MALSRCGASEAMFDLSPQRTGRLYFDGDLLTMDGEEGRGSDLRFTRSTDQDEIQLSY